LAERDDDNDDDDDDRQRVRKGSEQKEMKCCKEAIASYVHIRTTLPAAAAATAMSTAGWSFKP
jgi:hypothetical protein